MNTINGLILAGGESSRMGSDKGLMDFHGLPQREHLQRLLSTYCSKVFLSCKPSQDIPVSLNPLPDQFEIKSPLNGVLTALTSDHRSAWLVVPVDMPMIGEKHIEYLLSNRDETRMATCFYDSDGEKPEPLFAIWEPKALEAVQEFCNEGRRSVRDFLMTHDVLVLECPFPEMHLNVNSVEEYRNFKGS